MRRMKKKTCGHARGGSGRNTESVGSADRGVVSWRVCVVGVLGLGGYFNDTWIREVGMER